MKPPLLLVEDLGWSRPHLIVWLDVQSLQMIAVPCLHLTQWRTVDV